MDTKTRLRTVHSKIDMERDNYENWRQQHWLTCINRNPKRYIEVLETFDLNNHITKATWSEKKLIHHIISNILANKILHSDILPCPTIGNHNVPYIIANMPVNKFETRYKYIRNLKNFELEKFVQGITDIFGIFLWWTPPWKA